MRRRLLLLSILACVYTYGCAFIASLPPLRLRNSNSQVGHDGRQQIQDQIREYPFGKPPSSSLSSSSRACILMMTAASGASSSAYSTATTVSITGVTDGEHPLLSTSTPCQIKDNLLWREEALAEREEIMERTGSKDVEIRLPEIFTPLERIAISAEGDLQRIVSSYYNSAVSVTINRCVELEPGLFDREVDLSVFGEVFATASSRLEPRTSECAQLLRNKSLGLGQLFRYLKVYPDFRLLNVGKTTQGFWRLYEIDCPGVITCRILEQFAPDTFHRTLRPSSSPSSPSGASSSSSSSTTSSSPSST